MSVQLDFDIDVLGKRLESDLESAAIKTLHVIEEDIEPFVPYNTGELSESAVIDESSLSLVWEAEYADYVYNMPKSSNFNKEVHSKATSGWVDEALKVYKDKWVDDFKRNFSRR